MTSGVTAGKCRWTCSDLHNFADTMKSCSVSTVSRPQSTPSGLDEISSSFQASKQKDGLLSVFTFRLAVCDGTSAASGLGLVETKRLATPARPHAALWWCLPYFCTYTGLQAHWLCRPLHIAASRLLGRLSVSVSCLALCLAPSIPAKQSLGHRMSVCIQLPEDLFALPCDEGPA